MHDYSGLCYTSKICTVLIIKNGNTNVTMLSDSILTVCVMCLKFKTRKNFKDDRNVSRVFMKYILSIKMLKTNKCFNLYVCGTGFLGNEVRSEMKCQ